MDQALREARGRVATRGAARARARREALSVRAATLAASVAGSVLGALSSSEAPGEDAQPPLGAMHARADAALAAAAQGHTAAGWLRAASGRLYRGWGLAVFKLLCWLLGVRREVVTPPAPDSL
jgi:hypothetical protein